MKPAVGWTLAVVLAVAGAAGGYWYGMSQGMKQVAPAAPPAPVAPVAEAGRKILYWYDPMYPQQRFDKPGKSPFMDMQLVPKYADEAGAKAPSRSIRASCKTSACAPRRRGRARSR